MSITLRTTTNTSTDLLDGGAITYATSTDNPLTAEEVDKNFITLKQKIDEIEADYDATFTSSGAVKDGAISTASLGDGSITGAKIKDRAIDWADQRNIVYINDESIKVNEVSATLTDYLHNTGLSAIPANTVFAFKAAIANSGPVNLILKNKNTSDDSPTNLLTLEIFKQKDVSLNSGDLKEGGFYLVYYDGTTLQLANSLQDPEVVVEQNISAVSTFGPLSFDLNTMAVNASTAQPHNLGERPTTFDAYLICVGAEHGYSIGDKISLDSLSGTAAGVDAPIIVRATASQIIVIKTDEGLKIPSATNGNVSDLNDTNWDLEVRGTYRNDNTYSPAYVDRSLDYMARRAHSAITVGNYLYYFHNGYYDDGKVATIKKINLITNKVIDLGSASLLDDNHLCNASYIPFNDAAIFEATSGSIITGQGGSGYAVGEILTLSNATGSGTSSATFKVVTVDSGNNNAVLTVEVVTTGQYTTQPENGTQGVATTTGGSGSGAKINVSFATDFSGRIYWTTTGGRTYYLEPNGSDAKESVIASMTAKRNESHRYNVQEIDSGTHYGFKNRTSSSADIRLYTWSNGSTLQQYGSKILNIKNVQDSDGLHPIRNYDISGLAGATPLIKSIQWNKKKDGGGRIYVITEFGLLVHIFRVAAGIDSLKDWFDASGTPESNLTYEKTIGIPTAGSWSNNTEYDGFHIDIDVSTGEEKSISIANHNTVVGTVTRAAWREG